MTTINSITCKYERPDSVTDSDAEEYEYMLFWISANGNPNYWLFEDFIKSLSIKGTVINTESENINKLFVSAKQGITLVAEDLTLNEADNIAEILRAKDIRRYKTDNSYSKLAISTTKYKRQQSDFQYNVKIVISEIDKNIY